MQSGFLHTLRGKLLLSGILIQSLLLASYFLVTSSILRESMASNLATSVRTTSEIIHLGIAPYSVEGRFDILQDFFNELISGSDDGLRYIVVMDENKNALIATGVSIQNLPIPSINAKEAIAKGIYHVRQPVLLSGNHIGEVQFGISTLGVLDLLERMIRVALLVSVCGILLSGLLLAVFGHRFKRRFSMLINATQEIVSGNYQKKVPEHGKDELSHLASHFNAMSRALEVREKKFVTVFNAAPIPMFLLIKDEQTQSYRRTEYNLASRKIFGNLNDISTAILPCSDDDNARLINLLEQDNKLHPTEIALNFVDGHTHPCLVSGQCFDVDNINYLILAAMDIADLRKAQNDLQGLNRELEQRVEQRTTELAQRNHELDSALQTIQHAQEQLIQSEKLSSLGSMVAGVAHELNTPIGNSLTVASALLYNQKQFKEEMLSGVRKSELDAHLEENQLAGELLVRNLQRAAELITSFKAVSVDRTSSQRRVFPVSEIIEEIILSMSPMFRSSGVKIECELDNDIQMDSFPGPLGQIISNLLSNALTHGINPGMGERIDIHTHMLDKEHFMLSVSDDGAGIPAEHLGKIFDPFFTTKLGQGGSGLGLNIVYNLVTGLLGGQIQVKSSVGQGSAFFITLPLSAPVDEKKNDAA